LSLKQRILVVENVAGLCQTYMISLERAGFAVDGAGSLQEALDLMDARTFHVALVDLMLRDPEDSASMEGLDVLQKVKELDEGTQSIVLSGQEDVQTVVETIKQYGAFYYISKAELQERGVGYLVEQISKALESVKIKRYGGAENVLPVLAGGEMTRWVDRCLITLQPKGGYYGLRSFFAEFCESMVPLMPQRGISQPLAIYRDRCLATGRFWSKCLALPVELVVCSEENAPQLLQEKPEWSNSRSRSEHRSSGLVGYAFDLPGVARSEFVEKR
jgi:ActR/RegA family two-component response regulator